jgi:hypothetical protein
MLMGGRRGHLWDTNPLYRRRSAGHAQHLSGSTGSAGDRRLMATARRCERTSCRLSGRSRSRTSRRGVSICGGPARRRRAARQPHDQPDAHDPARRENPVRHVDRQPRRGRVDVYSLEVELQESAMSATDATWALLLSDTENERAQPGAIYAPPTRRSPFPQRPDRAAHTTALSSL